MIQVRFLLAFQLYLVSSTIYAEDFAKLYHFAEENRNIVTHLPEVAALENPNFHLTPEQADQILSLSHLDREIDHYAYSPSLDHECQEEQKERHILRESIAERSLQLYFTASYSGSDTYDQLEHIINRDTYAHFIYRNMSAGNPYNHPIANFQTLKRYYEISTRQKIDELSPLEQVHALEGYIKDYFDLDVPRDFIIEEALSEAMIQNPENWRQVAKDFGDELNFEQKMRIAARMGNTFLLYYNYDRLEGGSDGEIVSMEQLLEAAKNNTPGGVCRDVSFAQSQMLQEMGVPKDKIYIMGYVTTGGNHSVLMVQDPENPDNLIKLNYGDITQDDRNIGPEALRQYTTLPDLGISYRIFDADARPIGQLPTELGQVLRDVTNARESLIKTQPYELTQVGASNGPYHVNVFTGTTSSGDDIVGAAFNTTFEHSEHLSTDVGGGVVQQKYQSPIVEINQTLLYGRLATEFNTGEVHFGDVSVQGEAGGQIEILYGHFDGDYLNNPEHDLQGQTFDLTNEYFVGGTAVYENSPESRLKASAHTYHYIDFANETRASDYTLAFDRLEASVTYENDLTPEAQALAQAGIVIRQYGQAAYMRGALEQTDSEGHQSNYYIDFSTPLSEDTPSFMPESEQTIGFGTEQNFNNDWNLNLDYQYGINTNNHRGNFFLGRDL